MTRPDFENIKSFEEFQKYYWYLEELKTICRAMNIPSGGGKLELQDRIKKYLNGEKIETVKTARTKKTDSPYTPETKVIESGFTFGKKAKEFFVAQTGKENFHFTADMVASVKKAKEVNDTGFSLQDLLDIYYNKKSYAKYDKSVCQWNQFVKDFYADLQSDKDLQNYLVSNKIDKKELVIFLWKKVRDSDKEKIYSRNLIKLWSENKNE